MKGQNESLSQDTQLGGLVKKPAPEPKPHEKVREGVFKDADGKLFTDLPTPPSPTIWEAFRSAGLI